MATTTKNKTNGHRRTTPNADGIEHLTAEMIDEMDGSAAPRIETSAGTLLDPPPQPTSESLFINPNTIPVPPTGKAPKEYSRFLRDMNRYADGFDTNLGRIRWLQGMVLNMVRPQIKTRPEWLAYLKSVKTCETTAKYCRKIAVAIPEDNSTRMTYHEMLKKAYPSYRETGDTIVAKEIEREDAKDFAPTSTASGDGTGEKTQSNAAVPFGLSQLQTFMRDTKRAVQAWVDNAITTDLGFDIVENTKLDILNSLTDSLLDSGS